MIRRIQPNAPAILAHLAVPSGGMNYVKIMFRKIKIRNYNIRSRNQSGILPARYALAM